MKALTLIQPWATAICDYDKRVENRNWKPPQWLIGKQLAIHAGKSVDRHGVSYLLMNQEEEEEMPKGGVVAVVTVTGFCTRDRLRDLPLDQDRWFFGPYGWLLKDVQVLSDPVPCRGAQGLWDVPDDVLAEVMSQIKKESKNR